MIFRASSLSEHNRRRAQRAVIPVYTVDANGVLPLSAFTKEEYAARIEAADAYDELGNATQPELLHTGELHNYSRMLWGKRIIAWQATSEDAFHLLEHLNNKYALDGRSPNCTLAFSDVLASMIAPGGRSAPVSARCARWRQRAWRANSTRAIISKGPKVSSPDRRLLKVQQDHKVFYQT